MVLDPEGFTELVEWIIQSQSIFWAHWKHAPQFKQQIVLSYEKNCVAVEKMPLQV